MSPYYALGVDPGHAGGAVLLAGDGAGPARMLDAVGWRKSRGGYVLTSGRGWQPTMHDVGIVVDACVGASLMSEGQGAVERLTLVVEGLYVASLDRGPSVITLAELTGQVMGPMLHGLEPLRPKASRWRAKVLRLPRTTPAKQAEAYAMRCVGDGAICLPVVGEEWESPHVCEAACLAMYGLMARGREG